jgi:exodeoxyribonuclease VII large subunit
MFAPVLVQGDGAPPQLVNALRRINAADAADVIIIGRGGGSIEELWAFNDESVARAVASSRIPVISAVGHETDFTICDFVADLRAPTPSAAAELAVPDQQQLLLRIGQLYANSRRAAETIVKNETKALDAIRSKRCLASPLFYVEEHAMRLDYITRAFAGAAQVTLSRAERRLATVSGKLDAMSPLKVLSRGYSIAYKGESVIKSTADVTLGDKLSVRLSDGSVTCTVEDTISV